MSGSMTAGVLVFVSLLCGACALAGFVLGNWAEGGAFLALAAIAVIASITLGWWSERAWPRIVDSAPGGWGVALGIAGGVVGCGAVAAVCVALII